MAYDRTQKRIRAVQSKLSRGLISGAAAKKELIKLSSLGPRWVARIEQLDGTERTIAAKSMKDAKRIEAIALGEMESGAYQDPLRVKVPLREVFDFYLNFKLKGKASFRNARALFNYATTLFGERLTLWDLDQKAEKILPKHFDNLPKSIFKSDKHKWNYRTMLHASVNYYIKQRRLRILNPFSIIDMAPNTRVRNELISEKQYIQLKITCSNGYPAWLTVLVTSGWEMGLRVGEYLSWMWENIELNPTDGSLPWLKTLLQKQHGKEPVWREVPMTAAVQKCLKDYQEGQTTGPLFALSRATIDKYVRLAFNEAGLKAYKFHDFRRSWKKRHLDSNQRLRMLYQGHKTIAMDDYYLVLERKDMEAIVGHTFFNAETGETDTDMGQQ